MKIRLTQILLTLIILLIFWLYWVIPPAPPSLKKAVPANNNLKKTVPANNKPMQKPLSALQQKKQAFFEFLYPKIEQADIEIMRERAWIQSHPYQADHPKWQQLMQTYKVKLPSDKPVAPATIKAALLKKVDLIPPAMALAQAANESAWGNSRFAKEGKNYFGQWCYQKGCGIEPKMMDPQHYHAVKKFKSVLDSVRSYLRNINTHAAYQPVREIRWHLIKQEKKFPYGIYLVDGLVNYSQRREAYVRTLKSMIRHNQLQKYDEKLRQTLKNLGLPQ